VNIPFKATVVANEIDLNTIAPLCGIPKKYTWEEPLVLRRDALAKALGDELSQDSAVYIFSFGSVVFVNLPQRLEAGAFAFLNRMGVKPDPKESKKYTDVYELRISPDPGGEEGVTLTDEFARIEAAEPYHADLTAMIIAKSVALEKIEDRLMEIMDGIEPLIDHLEKGNLRVSDKKLAMVSSQIARYEYTTLAYIMLLDKPDITWTNSDALAFYDAMSDFFELSDRYEILKQKTELLNNVVGNISSTSHTVKSVFIEVAVLLLIAVEVVIMVIDLFK
jgi:uncharacterized Rmd1/YagE family protein